ncbi:hypothetical protein A3F65_02855 [Candidatus Saccharibacteria bacterium RIFCSPHIGHO2_12_FULL_47_16b]|nr:MAG: hypothetical protein A3F65_02855 [Candidatus Saccharibacteria bacterium RIFCSPHIGHO2_12_FULL_47_16b]
MSEQERPNHIPSYEAVTSAYDEILEYNRKHTGLGVGLANLFLGLMPVGEEEDSEVLEQNDVYESMNQRVENRVVEGDMHGELQTIVHSDTFMRLGIKIAPFGSTWGGAMGERISSRGLLPILENTELYKEFLSTIDPKQVDISRDKFLTAVLSNLARTIELAFDPVERERLPEEFHELAEQGGENSLRDFLSIEPEYKRLGLDPETLRKKFPNPGPTTRTEKHGDDYYEVPMGRSERRQAALERAEELFRMAEGAASVYERLNNYVNYWGRGLLPEFIVADREQYLKDPKRQGFGPAQWHHDGGQRRWREAVEFVASLEQQDRTKDFAEELRRGMIHSLDVALKEIADALEPPYFAKYRNDLANVRNCLSGKPYDAEALMRFTEPPNYNF